jgi:hypothetical protein
VCGQAQSRLLLPAQRRSNQQRRDYGQITKRKLFQSGQVSEAEIADQDKELFERMYRRSGHTEMLI